MEYYDHREDKVVFVGDKHLYHNSPEIIGLFEQFVDVYRDCKVKIILEHSYRSSNLKFMYDYAKLNGHDVEVFDPRIELIDSKINYSNDFIRIRYIIYNNIYNVRRDLCFYVLKKLKCVYNVEGVTDAFIRELESSDRFLNVSELIKLREILADYMDHEMMKKIEVKKENEMIFIVAGTYHLETFKKIKEARFNNIVSL